MSALIAGNEASLSVVAFCFICWGKKGLVPYSKTPRKQESGRLRKEENKIKFIDSGFERLQVLGLWEGRGK